MKSTVTKDFTRSFEESVKMIDENPESYIPETAEVGMSLDSIDIPDHLIEIFKENFKDKVILKEEDIFGFLDANK
jgi:hypothetical protein